MLGWTHRSDRLHLVLVLPDGSRSLVPAAWTDLKTPADTTTAEHAPSVSLAALADLRQARTVVDALLRRLPTPGEEPSPPDAEEGIVQMRLTFLDPPVPEASVWDALEDEHRAVVIDALARLVAKAAVAPPLEEPRHE